MSSFYGLEIAKTGLYVSQKGMNLAGHNIANADTAGYTRQRLSLVSIEPGALTARYLPLANGAVGKGVNVNAVEQLRNAYVDRALRSEYSGLGQWSTRSEEMTYMESLFQSLLRENDKASLASCLSNFFDSVQELSKDPVSKEIRTNMQQSAITLTQTFNHYYKQLTDLRNQMNDSIQVTTNRINEITKSIADYNLSIETYELSGENANDLRDKRNLLLDELSTLVDMEYSTNSQGQLSVTIAGNTVVNHGASTDLKVKADANGMYSVHLDDATETQVNYTNGTLAGYKQLRDGNTADNIGIPYMLEGLNTLARSIAKQFNDIHKTGWTMPHDSVASQTNVYLFDVAVVGGVEDYSSITAGNFKISDAVLNDVYKIAASSKEIDLSSSAPETKNADIALKLAALGTSSATMANTSFEGFLKNIAVELGVASAHCSNMLTSQQALVANLETRKESVSGVSVDEEIIHLMKFQHMYNASSRIINAIDEALDKLINGTGMVGR